MTASTRPLRRLFACMWQQRAHLIDYPTPRADQQRVLITGGNGGIGLATARGLLRRGADVTIACRNPEKARHAAQQLLDETGQSVDIALCDLADLGSVAQCAGALDGVFDVLICNAGVWAKSYAETAQGHEISFGVNVLGHFLLIEKMIDRGVLAEGARVVIVTGDIYVMVSDCSPDYRYRGALGGQWAYCRSKLGNLWLRHALEDAHPDRKWFAVHPGVVTTNLAGAASGPAWLTDRLLISPDEGAQTSIACATVPDMPTGYHHNTLGHVALDPTDPGANAEGWRRMMTQCVPLIAPYR
ncbi:MAG: SDR family NAD(P)-dependent oxidoreductase [Myxococcota bacterium]